MTLRIQPIATPSQLGAVLLSTRKSLKLTQQALAGRMGLSQRRLSELERAPGTLSVDQLLALCNQLGLQLSVQPQAGEPTPAETHPGEW